MSIDSIQLQNFQSHKDTTIELHPGINAIIGESDKGKSSILRGLYLCRYNQPSGEAYISKWARNEKGIQKKQLSVTIKKGKNELIRGKGPAMKGYLVNNKPFITLKKNEVPEDVQTFFNTSEVNIQEQMDTPFLLGLSSPEKAKFLNTIVDMSDIDLYLSTIDSKIRSNRKEVKIFTKEIVDLSTQLDKYDKLDSLSPLLNKLGKIEKRIDLKNRAIQKLSKEVDTYNDISKRTLLWQSVETVEGLLNKYVKLNKRLGQILIDHKKLKNMTTEYKEYQQCLKLSDTTELEKSLKTIEKLVKDQNRVNNNLSSLKVLIKDYKEYQSIIDSTIDFDTLSKKLTKLEKIKKNITKKQVVLSYLKDTHNKVHMLQQDIGTYTKEIEKLTTEIPEQCPTCGTVLKESL